MSEWQDKVPEGVEASFVVDDDMKAEWCLKKIKEALEQKKIWKAFYEDRLDKVNKAQDATIAYMKYLLFKYFKTIEVKTTKTQQSYVLPSGKLVLKKKKPDYHYDEKELIGWLKDHDAGGYIRTYEKVDWDPLKSDLMVIEGKVVTPDGEIVDVIQVEERPDEFNVEGLK